MLECPECGQNEFFTVEQEVRIFHRWTVDKYGKKIGQIETVTVQTPTVSPSSLPNYVVACPKCHWFVKVKLERIPVDFREENIGVLNVAAEKLKGKDK